MLGRGSVLSEFDPIFFGLNIFWPQAPAMSRILPWVMIEKTIGGSNIGP